MEAGYDYTLLGGRPQGKGRYVPALVVGVLAGVLLVSGLVYYGVAADAQADLSSLQDSANSGSVESAAQVGEASPAEGGSTEFTRYVAPASAGQIAAMELYPAGLSEAVHWVNPLGYDQ